VKSEVTRVERTAVFVALMLKFERAWCVGNIYLVIQKARVSTNQSNVIIDHILRLGTTTTFHSVFIIHHH
jgi:hypothetical protein